MTKEFESLEEVTSFVDNVSTYIPYLHQRIENALKYLAEYGNADPEKAHWLADNLLSLFVPKALVDLYHKVPKWYA